MGAVAVASRRQRRFPWGPATAVLVAGLTTGAVVALIHSRSPSSPARRATPSASATLDPANVTWQDYGGAAVPQAPAGPHDTQGGRAAGFDHSPAGATLAAINLTYRVGSAAGPSVFGPTITQQVVGPDRDQLLGTIQAQYAKDGPQTPDQIAAVRAQSSTTWAYKVDAYTANAASVEVLLRSIPPDKTPTYVNLSLTVDWEGADWALVAPAHGEWSSVSRIVTAVPSGYTVLKTGGA